MNIRNSEICPLTDILNPKTGRCVSKKGQTGSKLLEIHQRNSRKLHKKYKIVSTIIFIIVLTTTTFIIGYNKDKDKIDKNGNKYTISHHLLEGFKWVGIIYAIIFIISIFIAYLFLADFWTLWFFGGEFFSFIFNLIGTLILELSN